MGLLEELKERADKLDAEHLALASRMKEIGRESAEVATCINALEIAEMDAEEYARAVEAEPGSDALEIPEGFTKWEGGPCPVADDVRIEVVFRNGLRTTDLAEAYSMDGVSCWVHERDEHDIIAYRVLPSEPAGEGETRAEAAINAVVDKILAGVSIPEDAAALHTYVDGDDTIARVVTAEELYTPTGYQHVVDAEPAGEPYSLAEVEAEEPRDPDLVLTEAVLEEITDLAEQKLEAVPVEHPDAPFWARVLTRQKEDA